ncbi:cytochrome P450 9b2-like [Oppia nitens]|uniref:cytochrome P450 9b2-like n=1 Tax=Oppia nitens TaxID=1686743 RepID=UPI0023DCA1A4|nr:cytochrome P450 9b2-like [Oppia nitens]
MMTSDPKLIKNIYIKHYKNFSDPKSILMTPDNHVIYRHIINNSRGETWRRQSAVIRSLFADSRLKLFAKKITENLINLTDSLDKMIDNNNNDKAIDISQVFINHSIDLMANCMFSLKQNTINSVDNKFSQIIKQSTMPSKWRILASLVLPKFLVNVLDMSTIISRKYLDQFVRLTVQELSKRISLPINTGNDDDNDFCQLLMNRCPDFISNKTLDNNTNNNNNNNNKTSESQISDLSQTLTNDELIANIYTLFDSAYGIDYILKILIIYELAINTECQQKCYDEIIANCFPDNNKPMTGQNNIKFDYKTVDKLNYLDACISEIMRLYAQIYREGRIARHDYTDETTGVTIKKGQVIQFSRSAVHRNSDYYPMPDQFRPERFVGKQNKHQLIESAVYLPFGLGRRMCPGYKFTLMTIKLTMAQLLVNYRFLPIPGLTKLRSADPIVEHYSYYPGQLYLKIEKR